VRNHHPTPGQQDPDLHDREVLLDPRPDPLLLAEQRPPSLAVTVAAMRAHSLHHLTDQLIGELLHATTTLDAEPDRRGDVTPRRLAINTDSRGDRPFTIAVQPAPQRLSDLDHRNLPERHRASSSETQPNDSSAGVGGPSRGPITGNRGGPMPLAKTTATWSHVAGKRQS
jgi:hypothetical protein